MKIRPLHDRVIVKRKEEERKTASGIVIPDSASTEKPDMGTIIAVGPGKRDDNGKLVAMGVNVGDSVLFGKYAGQTVKIDGEEVLVMREEDIMGVVEA
jgi:chaperonin GroES